MNQFTKFENISTANALISKALEFKADPHMHPNKGQGKRLGLIFLNPSLRTRVSTQIAASNLGLESFVLNMDKDTWALEMHDGTLMNKNKVEHIKDAAGVLGSYFDILAIRAFPSLTNKQEDTSDFILKQFIQYSGVPVVSLESAVRHPLQSLADMVTIRENIPSGKKPKVVLSWAPHIKAIPHAVANSFAEWSMGCDYDLTITHPEGYELDEQFTQGADIQYNQNKALEDADFVYVKNWSAYNPYGKILAVDEDWLLTEKKLKKNKKAKVMHCLPVRRNLELGDDILDGPRSLVQAQAKNRIFAAQAVLDGILS
ncbi:acetylornithine carbamoyltransferase [Negadavirga shengliensis]|uniref:N-succinylornithine carbamoyltransferase n=1 Tax=Negadavirga shengliensis TaxID=1389218 RepID=A0ABV9SZJ3_9BACT